MPDPLVTSTSAIAVGKKAAQVSLAFFKIAQTDRRAPDEIAYIAENASAISQRLLLASEVLLLNPHHYEPTIFTLLDSIVRSLGRLEEELKLLVPSTSFSRLVRFIWIRERLRFKALLGELESIKTALEDELALIHLAREALRRITIAELLSTFNRRDIARNAVRAKHLAQSIEEAERNEKIVGFDPSVHGQLTLRNADPFDAATWFYHLVFGLHALPLPTVPSSEVTAATTSAANEYLPQNLDPLYTNGSSEPLRFERSREVSLAEVLAAASRFRRLAENFLHEHRQVIERPQCATGEFTRRFEPECNAFLDPIHADSIDIGTRTHRLLPGTHSAPMPTSSHSDIVFEKSPSGTDIETEETMSIFALKGEETENVADKLPYTQRHPPSTLLWNELNSNARVIEKLLDEWNVLTVHQADPVSDQSLWSSNTREAQEETIYGKMWWECESTSSDETHSIRSSIQCSSSVHQWPPFAAMPTASIGMQSEMRPPADEQQEVCPGLTAAKRTNLLLALLEAQCMD